jgi:cytochrome c oxidase subunit II
MNRTLSINLMRVSVALSFLMSSCGGGPQHALDSAGTQAGKLESLWWIFFWVTAAVYVIVMAVLLAAIMRRRRAAETSAPELELNQSREQRASTLIKAAVTLTLLTMFTLMLLSFRTGRAITTVAHEAVPLEIQVTGNQWWWDIEYRDPVPSNNIRTANELHLPVGRPVRLTMQSIDVIHSFWLPNMHGKMDLIPGYKTSLVFRPDEIGTFFGQCAEFCGYQHAKMRFVAVVESQEDYERWATAQRAIPASPVDPTASGGQQLFLQSVCTQCHTVAGTTANARVGPDLTHVASRHFIAAGSIRNVHDHLKTWITDPHTIKPGVRMPANRYSDEDLNALVTYLEGLK